MLYSPEPLHIPDGFLSFTVSIICWVISAVTISLAVSRSNKSLGERQVPLMGIMAAFIFAAQMINFPVAGGTSGHLLGGALAAITLGPWAGMLVMTAVIAVQALLFQDGGLLALGANVFNMGVLTALVGIAVYRTLTPLGRLTSAAPSIAGFAASNTAIRPSPSVLTVRPPWCSTCSLRAKKCASRSWSAERSLSASNVSVDATMSVNRIVRVRRRPTITAPPRVRPVSP